MMEQSPVKGCGVIMPWGMGIWELVRNEMDRKIKGSGAENAYFPLLIPQSFLSKEADHVEGFAKECAVVTHHRLMTSDDGKIVVDPEAKLEEPLIVRPTSETMIWHMFGKWIKSYRDLPLKMNQWANVMRWELRTRPFLRSAEFLWQEGHTAHASKEEALDTALEMLDIYADVVENYLGVPVIKGSKTKTERFAGAEETYTIEGQMQNGWALQSGTSHFLGQNFAKAFDVQFQDKETKRSFVYATSWGVSTRLLGAVVMTHADDLGLKLPPTIAPVQVVIIPVAVDAKKKKDDFDLVQSKIDDIVSILKKQNIRYKVDDRDYMRPGPKFFEWEKKGVPLRIEIGPRDAKNDQCVVVPRWERHMTSDKVAKVNVNIDETFADNLKQRLTDFQEGYFREAQQRLREHTFYVSNYKDMTDQLLETKGGFFLAPWCDDADNEKQVKVDCKATIRCYPFDPDALVDEPDVSNLDDKKCFYSGRPATHIALFARAF